MTEKEYACGTACSDALAAALYAGGASVTMGGATGLSVLVLGRALYGLGIGFAMHAAPAFIAEAAPAKVRGLLIRYSAVHITESITAVASAPEMLLMLLTSYESV